MSEERDQRGRLPIRRRAEPEPTDLANALADREMLRLEFDQLRAPLAEALTTGEAILARAGFSAIEEHEYKARLAELRKLVGR